MPSLCPIVGLVTCLALLGCTPEPASKNPTGGEASPSTESPVEATTLVGQLLLPGEGGRRGVELHAWVMEPDGERHQIWVLPDADGRFAREVPGTLTHVRVVAGSEVHRIDGDDLPRVGDGGTIDLGTIDLRDRLVAHRVRVRAAEGSPGGVVRVGLWIGPPPRGPRGGLPSLGSRQFRNVELGTVIERLLLPDASGVHLLVERPDGPSDSTNWRSGEQWAFGPYASSAFPLELVIE